MPLQEDEDTMKVLMRQFSGSSIVLWSLPRVGCRRGEGHYFLPRQVAPSLSLVMAEFHPRCLTFNRGECDLSHLSDDVKYVRFNFSLQISKWVCFTKLKDACYLQNCVESNLEVQLRKDLVGVLTGKNEKRDDRKLLKMLRILQVWKVLSMLQVTMLK